MKKTLLLILLSFTSNVYAEVNAEDVIMRIEQIKHEITINANNCISQTLLNDQLDLIRETELIWNTLEALQFEQIEVSKNNIVYTKDSCKLQASNNNQTILRKLQ